MVRILIFLLFCSTAFAKEGVITVLEAPIFTSPDSSSPVVQYIRKGAKIYIHAAEMAVDRYEGLIEESDEKIRKYDKDHSQMYPDKLFPEGETYFPEKSSKFYKTLTKSGADGYILKDHVFLLYKDTREFSQKELERDPTDYRIEEPLPKGYPLAQETGYRGQYLFSMGTPSTDSYPYSESIADTGFDYNKELIMVWNRQIKWDLSRRFFFGGIFYFHSSNIEHVTDNITATENLFRMGVGPYLSYDIWKTKEYAINFYGAITYNFYNTIEISQEIQLNDTGNTSISDKREYKAQHFSSRMGTQFFIKDVFEDLDFIIGANINLELPHTYNASTNPQYDQYWEESFYRSWSVQQSYFVGFQSDY